MLVLNLTLPPLLVIYLAPALFANVSLPAQPASAVAAFLPNGTPIPCWVIQNRLYVLQLGYSSVIKYVPNYINTNNELIISINASSGAVIVVPPGVMVVDVKPKNYTILSINRSGLYLSIKAPNATIKYGAIMPVTLTMNSTTTWTSPPTSTAPTSPTMASSAPATTTPTASPSTPAATSSTASEGLALWTYLLATGAVVTAVVIYLALRRGGDCGGLGETDLLIIKTLDRMGGAATRPALAQTLGLPASTLHKHLHKLSRYGYVRLVTEGGAQRVELLKRC